MSQLAKERAIRLLRAKAAKLEAYVKNYKPGDVALTPVVHIIHLTADIALVASLLADHMEESNEPTS